MDRFAALYAEHLQCLPDLITQQIAAAVNDRQRNRYLDAREVITARRAQLGQAYQQALEHELDQFAGNEEAEPQSSVPAPGLSLVDKAEYEDDVAIRALSTRNAALYTDELWQLDRRLALLRGGRKFDSEKNPCGPWVLCAAVQQVYRTLEIDSMAKLLLYKSYEGEVLSQAGTIYRELNAELASHGILPHLSYQLVRARSSAAGGGRAVQHRGSHGGGSKAAEPPPDDSETAPGGRLGARPHTGEQAANDPPDAQGSADHPPYDSVVPRVTPETQRRQARVVRAVRAMQQRTGRSGLPWGSLACDGEVGGADTVPVEAIVGVIEMLQQSPVAALQQPGELRETERGLVEQLEQLCVGAETRKVAALDADTIDLVGMLFNFILNDPRLPDSVKSLLSHLHTPYLKVALLDRSFIDSANHPARRLLDLLAGTGQRWLLEGEEDDKVYQRMRCVVERVLAEFKQDPAFFDEVLRDFTGFVGLLEKRAKLTAKRSAEAERGLEQLQLARSAAGRELGVRMQSIELPEALWEALQQTWSDHLVYIYLRHGESSTAWDSAIALFEDVLRSLGHEGRLVPEQQAKLRESVALDLEHFGCDPQRVEALLQALDHAQLEISAAPRDAAGADSDSRPKLSAIARQVERQSSEREVPRLDLKKATPQELELVQKLSAIEFGTWFEFRPEGARPGVRKLRLAWYSSVSGNYMFVNASGVKTAVEPLAKLVRGILAGTVVIEGRERRNLFERAMTSALVRMNKH